MTLHHIPIQFDLEIEKKMAKKTCSHLERTLSTEFKGPIFLKINNESVELPVSIFNPLLDLLNNISKGQQSIENNKKTLTTQQAADLLNVSRPFLIKLIDTQQLPSYKVGKHRRVFEADLLAFKENSLKERKKILQKLVDEAQELDLGY